jgi:hypothetical protein
MNSPKKAPTDRQKSLSVRELISTQIELLGLKNPTVADALGYPNASIVSMLKNGTMKLPMDKVGRAAHALKLDPIFLARIWDSENGFGLIKFVEGVTGQVALTENEHRLIMALRSVDRGVDVNMEDHGDELNEMLRAYSAAAAKERSAIDGTLNRIFNKKKRSNASEKTLRPDGDAGDAAAA